MRLAVEHPDVPTFAVLLNHDRDMLDANLGHDSTALSKACANKDPELALYLLREGADPNAGGWFRLSTLQLALVQRQPVELIRALVDAGADTTDVVESAMEEDGEAYAKVLSEAGVRIESVTSKD